MSLADKLIYPIFNSAGAPSWFATTRERGGEAVGMTLLEHYAGLAWTLDEIKSVTGTRDDDCAAFIGIAANRYLRKIHYRVAAAKARVVLAQALIAELEKEQKK